MVETTPGPGAYGEAGPTMASRAGVGREQPRPPSAGMMPGKRSDPSCWSADPTRPGAQVEEVDAEHGPGAYATVDSKSTFSTTGEPQRDAGAWTKGGPRFSSDRPALDRLTPSPMHYTPRTGFCSGSTPRTSAGRGGGSSGQ